MQRYCVEGQATGARAVADFMARYGLASGRGHAVAAAILATCKGRHVEDLEMLAYCIDKQRRAAIRLRQLPAR